MFSFFQLCIDSNSTITFFIHSFSNSYCKAANRQSSNFLISDCDRQSVTVTKKKINLVQRGQHAGLSSCQELADFVTWCHWLPENTDGLVTALCRWRAERWRKYTRPSLEPGIVVSPRHKLRRPPSIFSRSESPVSMVTWVARVVQAQPLWSRHGLGGDQVSDPIYLAKAPFCLPAAAPPIVSPPVSQWRRQRRSSEKK